MINIRSCGAVGDGVTDDTGAVYVFLNALKRTGSRGYVPGGKYRCTGVINAMGVRRLDMDGEFVFEGTDGIVIGIESDVTNLMTECDLNLRVRNKTQGSIENAGLTMRGMAWSRVRAYVHGFGTAVRVLMSKEHGNEYFAFNELWLNLRAFDTALNVAQDTFCNENVWHNLTALWGIDGARPSRGIVFAGDGAANGNVFYKPCIEGVDAPITFAGGSSNNRVYDARLESSGAIIFGDGGSQGGTANNVITVAHTGDGLGFDHPATFTTPFPNYVRSSLFPPSQRLVVDVTTDSFAHMSETEGRNYGSDVLISKNSGGAFDWLSVGSETFTIGNYDEGFLDIPVSQGDNLLIDVDHVKTGGSEPVLRLDALDAAGDMMPADPATPYIGSTRHSTVGHSGASASLKFFSNYVEKNKGVRINGDFPTLRVSLMAGIAFGSVSIYRL